MTLIPIKTKREKALENDIKSVYEDLLRIRTLLVQRHIEYIRLAPNSKAMLAPVWMLDNVLAKLDYQDFDKLDFTYRDEP